MASKAIMKIYEGENPVPNALAAKKATGEPARRAALGELSNRTTAVLGKPGQQKSDPKATTTIDPTRLKNVKPKVVTHWNKESVATNRVERSNSTASNASTCGAAPAIRTTRTAALRAKAQLSKVTRLPPKRKDAPSKKSSLGSEVARAKVPANENGKPQSETTRGIEEVILKLNNPLTLHSNLPYKGGLQVPDIDENDKDKLPLCSIYVNDIYAYFYALEDKLMIKEKYLGDSTDLTGKMRAVLIDWIHEVHNQFKLVPETYYMAVSLIDQYLQKKKVTKSVLQLVGVTALYIASKFEEIYPPDIGDFVYVTDDSYDKRELLKMEIEILRTLDFHLFRPHAINFLRRFSKAARANEMHHAIAKYFLELATIYYEFVHYKPSKIAAASLYLALNLVAHGTAKENDSYWTSTLQYYSRYDEKDVRPLARQLVELAIRSAKSLNLTSVYDKYTSSGYTNVIPKGLLEQTTMQQVLELDFIQIGDEQQV